MTTRKILIRLLYALVLALFVGMVIIIITTIYWQSLMNNQLDSFYVAVKSMPVTWESITIDNLEPRLFIKNMYVINSVVGDLLKLSGFIFISTVLVLICRCVYLSKYIKRENN